VLCHLSHNPSSSVCIFFRGYPFTNFAQAGLELSLPLEQLGLQACTTMPGGAHISDHSYFLLLSMFFKFHVVTSSDCH
jgi:hypothetical protein